MWRQQEAYLTALDRYCAHLLASEGASPASIASLMERIGPRDKEEILRQNEIDHSMLPMWQRRGTAVVLGANGRVVVDTNLPKATEYRSYIRQHLA
jgi:tRNA(His) 5'-end guanylyltransferase